MEVGLKKKSFHPKCRHEDWRGVMEFLDIRLIGGTREF